MKSKVLLIICIVLAVLSANMVFAADSNSSDVSVDNQLTATDTNYDKIVDHTSEMDSYSQFYTPFDVDEGGTFVKNIDEDQNFNDNLDVLSVKNDENSTGNGSNEPMLNQGNEIQTFKIVNINSTGKGVVPLNITDGLSNKEITGEFSATLIYKEGNNDNTIPLNVLYENNNLIFDYPLPDYIPSATLEIVYAENGNKLYKNITLSRIFNAKIEVINNVNEFQTGNFTFKVVDKDTNAPISGRTVRLYTVTSSISAGFSAITNEEGIANFKTSDLYEFDNTNNSFTMKQLEVGNHTVRISMASPIVATTVNTELTIKKATLNIVINPYKEYYGSTKQVIINVTNANTGEAMNGIILHLYMANTTAKDYYFQTDANGQSKINVSGLDSGVYSVTVSNNDTKNINNKKVDGSITILGKPVSLAVSVPSTYCYNGGNIATITVKDMSTGKPIGDAIVLVQIKSDNSSEAYLYQTDDNGVINVNYDSTTVGLHEIVVNTADKRYIASSVTKTVTVKKSIDIDVSDIDYSQEAIIKINVAKELLDSEIFISISNDKGFEKSYYETAKETIIIKLSELDVSTYFVDVDCINSDNYQIHVNQSFNVSKLDIGDIDLPNELSSDEYLTFYMPTDATGDVIIYIDGFLYESTEIYDGEVSFPVEDLMEGNYSCRVYYSGDDNYNSFSKESILTILSPVLTISAKDMKVKYGGDYDFIAIFYNSDLDPLSNSNVIFNVNNKDYLVKTDYSGIAVLKIGLGNGTYKIKSVNLLTGEHLTKTLTIYDEPKPIVGTTIDAFGLTTVFNGGKYIVATLKDTLGNPLVGVYVDINVDNIYKSIKTDKNGQVKLSTNGLTPKSYYTAIITFDGNDCYEKSTTTVKVNVKKATLKVSAKSATFKKSVKTKKYSITLKTNQNKVMKNTKVTIKVNKISYVAKTNSKGVATFKITKLTKKGTFKSVISYKGDKYYNKLTKTINIKVK